MSRIYTLNSRPLHGGSQEMLMRYMKKLPEDASIRIFHDEDVGETEVRGSTGKGVTVDEKEVGMCELGVEAYG